MKLVAGLGSAEDYITLAKAGADEFFCGYVPFSWNQRYGVIAPLNRREVLAYNVQIGAKGDLYILKKMIDYYGIPIKITFNSLCYAPEQYPLIGEIMMECIQAGFDVFIVSDIGLLHYIRSQGIPCKIHLSGEAAEVNRPMMDLFREFDIARFIFHRKNTIDDMKRCTQAVSGENIEFEAFALNEYCHFTGAFCNSLHCDELTHLCKVPYKLGNIREQQEEKFVEVQDDSEEVDGYVTGSTGCGLCALMELKEAGVTHLKVVGRGNHVAYMEQDLKQMRKALALLEGQSSVEAYQQQIKSQLFSGVCSENCYYR